LLHNKELHNFYALLDTVFWGGSTARIGPGSSH